MKVNRFKYSRAPIIGTPINQTSNYPNSLFLSKSFFNRTSSYPNSLFLPNFFLNRTFNYPLAWYKILNKEKTDSGSENEECKTIKEMGIILSYEENEINKWLNSEVHKPGYQILNDDEIVDEIRDEKEIEENGNECSENNTGPSNNEAFECLETAMNWLEQ